MTYLNTKANTNLVCLPTSLMFTQNCLHTQMMQQICRWTAADGISQESMRCFH